GKPLAPSHLLEALEGRITEFGAQVVVWERADVGGAAAEPRAIGNLEPDAAEPDAPKPTVSVSALEQYQDCPRRYYYQRVENLTVPKEESAYLAFHDCLQQMTEWAQAQHAAGRTPSMEE